MRSKRVYSPWKKSWCPPRRLRIGYYFLTATLGRMEIEEAAARIIFFSHQLDRWVGVSWHRIVQMMKEDYDKEKAFEEKLERQNERMDAWFGQVNRHFWFCILTFGIWMLFVGKPQQPAESEELPEMPLSGIYAFGPEHVVTGLHELIVRGLLKKVTDGDGESARDVLFPTPALISRIMEMQGISV